MVQSREASKLPEPGHAAALVAGQTAAKLGLVDRLAIAHEDGRVGVDLGRGQHARHSPSDFSTRGTTAAWKRSEMSREENSSRGLYPFVPSCFVNYFDGKLHHFLLFFSNNIKPFQDLQSRSTCLYASASGSR